VLHDPKELAMNRPSVLVFVAYAVAAAACSKDGGGGGAGGSAGGGAAVSKYPGTEAGAQQMLTDIRVGDAKAMTAALRPTTADYKAVFADDVALKIQTGYDKLWSDPKAMISADPANTELKLWKATTQELQSGGGDAGQFPGGYKRIAGKLKPGLTLYRWKYVKPGKDIGMAFDGLIHVNGRWAWFPKPWRALGRDGGDGGDGSDGGGAGSGDAGSGGAAASSGGAAASSGGAAASSGGAAAGSGGAAAVSGGAGSGGAAAGSGGGAPAGGGW
jgi:hypothetical protein